MYPMLNVSVEVTVKDGDSSKQRGDLLEALAKRLLNKLQYEHISTEVRVTGCELDLIASEKQTGKRALIECKAYRDKTISADVLTKLLGNRMLHDYDVAWLISTSKLGKDASGIVTKMRGNPRKSQGIKVFGPDELVDVLVSTGEVVPPNTLKVSDGVRPTSGRTLLITDVGEYWAVPALGEKSGVGDTVFVFDATNGLIVADEALVQRLSERDSNLRDLAWVASSDNAKAISALQDAALKSELDNIASVPVADDWSDYRPSRPKDFVGRDELLNSILDFLDDAAAGETRTRLIAIKAPSGWGKSSFLVKLRSKCETRKYRSKYFVYGIDCRTASSSRYPELALKKCFEEAVEAGFVKNHGAINVTSSGEPFSDESIVTLLDCLRRENKLIVLFFDQFEEITTKQELSELFIQIKSMCSAIESAGENVILGFSWKTDGTIPTDHPAYHVWHSFSDRRREFELPLFSKSDTSRLLSRLSRELKQPIEPWLRRLLGEHSQGYPWLLKKLCVHVFGVLRSQPARQRELFERALDIEALFRKDLSDLDGRQMACLKDIADNSPADNFQVVEKFGDRTVDALMQRRLVIRNAGKLVVYWDIFRDYVLHGQVPAIPTRYVPVCSPASAKRVLNTISSSNFTQFSVLASKLGWKDGTLDNIARDLVMMGVCQYDRKGLRLKLLHKSNKIAVAAMHRFFETHAFMRALLDEFGSGFKGVALSSVENELSGYFANGTYDPKTVHVAIIRWLNWEQALGLFSIDANGAISHNASIKVLDGFDDLRISGRSRKGRLIFRGEASPSKVMDLLRVMAVGNYQACAQDRNGLYVLRSLRLIPSITQPVLLESPPLQQLELWLAIKVSRQPSFKNAMNIVVENPSVKMVDLGRIFEKYTLRTLSDASRLRYGNAMSVWIHWALDVLTQNSRAAK